MSDRPSFTLEMEQREHYQFDVTFDDPSWEPIRLDEPRPLGDGTAPNATRLLGAAIGNCLSASLVFCLEKARVPITGMKARVTVAIERNEKGRLRIGSVRAELHPATDVPRERLERCIGLFEDFCIVTQSVRSGIAVDVVVEPVEALAGTG